MVSILLLQLFLQPLPPDLSNYRNKTWFTSLCLDISKGNYTDTQIPKHISPLQKSVTSSRIIQQSVTFEASLGSVDMEEVPRYSFLISTWLAVPLLPPSLSLAIPIRHKVVFTMRQRSGYIPIYILPFVSKKHLDPQLIINHIRHVVCYFTLPFIVHLYVWFERVCMLFVTLRCPLSFTCMFCLKEYMLFVTLHWLLT